jgi:hypothetical protein
MNDRLSTAAYNLCIEMRDDPRWEAANNRPGNREGLEELRRRCPGFTDDEYARAMSQGLMASR